MRYNAFTLTSKHRGYYASHQGAPFDHPRIGDLHLPLRAVGVERSFRSIQSAFLCVGWTQKIDGKSLKPATFAWAPRCLAIVASILFVQSVFAEDKPSDLWIMSGFRSKHFTESDRKLNENNTGIGLQYKQVVVGIYKNSLSHSSNYLAYVWQPIKAGPVKLGASFGVVNGYDANGGGYIPWLLPTATIEWRHFGVNMVYIPKIEKYGAESTLAVQLKARF